MQKKYILKLSTKQAQLLISKLEHDAELSGIISNIRPARLGSWYKYNYYASTKDWLVTAKSMKGLAEKLFVDQSVIVQYFKHDKKSKLLKGVRLWREKI